ncbi:MAG: SDR family oxidoreductase [Bacteroidota bacterium]
MKEEFSNKWGIILGGSNGLGLATARKLANHGMNLCIVHRDRKGALEPFEKEVEQFRAMGVEVKTFNKDAIKQETLEEVLNEIPKQSIHLLLHSIAKGSVKPLLSKTDSLTTEDYQITIQAMGLSWLSWTQFAIQNDLFNPKARNIAFTSEGNSKAIPNYGAVSAAKATLEALMRQMAAEYAPLGLRTNCVQAGVTETQSFQRIPGSDRIAAFAKQRNPFHQLTQPEDVANAVYLLCREEADWINGTVLTVDGGESLR